jgi:hypothetical protein
LLQISWLRNLVAPMDLAGIVTLGLWSGVRRLSSGVTIVRLSDDPIVKGPARQLDRSSSEIATVAPPFPGL